MIWLKVIRLFLAGGIGLILVVALTSNVSKDLAEMDFALPYRTFENIDQECPVVCGADSGDILKCALFSIPPKLHRDLLKKNLYPFLEMASLCQQSPILRC